ncbi:MAG: hypothetical protein DIU78_013375, partial [Pseudomonadota bacterium]
ALGAHEGQTVRAVGAAGETATALTSVLRLDGVPPPAGIVMQGDTVLFARETPEGARIRRARIAW